VTPSQVVLAGHVYAPIGMGEHVRCAFRAFREAGQETALKDIYAMGPRTDADFVREFSAACVESLSDDINIFHINADEVDQSLAHLGERRRDGAYNIIYPAWELAHFPAPWVPALERFDEIWAPSSFIATSIAKSTKARVLPMPLACEVRLSSFIGRRAFGLPESAYIFFFYFDFTSYLDRKNPFGTLEAFQRLCEAMPHADVALAVKTNAARAKPQDLARFREAVAASHGRVIVIDHQMTDNETKNLVRCCDCFLSLHRSEGFGRGMSEAMYVGKPVIATGYSGNMDFMSDHTAFLVDYEPIPVLTGQYPFAEGQVWANPDLDQAVRIMRRLVENPSEGGAKGETASRHIRQYFSYRAVGLRYRERLDEIRREREFGAAAEVVREPARAPVSQS
jgi:glycosyltransferase involved in cell wall biosynthesis